jgi:extradiol dioxygenase family protein
MSAASGRDARRQALPAGRRAAEECVMPSRLIFHLSLPVRDLHEAELFYVGVLGAHIGRRAPDWIDALVWGHQITLQLRPDEVLPRDRQGKRHFGVILPWEDWQSLADRLLASGAICLSPPAVLFVGTPSEQGKLYLEDPSHNVIELKAYRDPRKSIGEGDPAYSYAGA